MPRAPSPLTESSTESSTSAPLVLPITLVKLSGRQLRWPAKLFDIFRAVLRATFQACPILTTTHTLCHRIHIHRPGANHISGSTRLSGTLYGHRKARITLAIQDSPGSVPFLLLELAVSTAKFMADMGSSGLIRVALECEKRAEKKGKCKTKLLQEPMWTAFVNGKKVGYGTRREATKGDLMVMQMLHVVSMGAGVLPESMTDPSDGELTYMRSHLERVIGNKDSETYYMQNPNGNIGSELSIFFVRI